MAFKSNLPNRDGATFFQWNDEARRTLVGYCEMGKPISEGAELAAKELGIKKRTAETTYSKLKVDGKLEKYRTSAAPFPTTSHTGNFKWTVDNIIRLLQIMAEANYVPEEGSTTAAAELGCSKGSAYQMYAKVNRAGGLKKYLEAVKHQPEKSGLKRGTDAIAHNFTNAPWSDSDNSVLVTEVIKANNIGEGSKNAAKILDRTYNNVNTHYHALFKSKKVLKYTHLTLDELPKKAGRGINKKSRTATSQQQTDNDVFDNLSPLKRMIKKGTNKNADDADRQLIESILNSATITGFDKLRNKLIIYFD